MDQRMLTCPPAIMAARHSSSAHITRVIAPSISSLPSEPTLIILSMAIEDCPHSVVNLIHVCSYWRRTILDDHILCAKVALRMKNVKLCMTFLRWAGNVCQPLLFDSILGHTGLTRPEQQKIITFLLDDTERLRNCTHIESLTHFHKSRWAARIETIQTFPERKPATPRATLKLYWGPGIGPCK